MGKIQDNIYQNILPKSPNFSAYKVLIEMVHDALNNLIIDHFYLCFSILNFFGSLITPLWIEKFLSNLVLQAINLFLDVMVSTVGGQIGACITYDIGLKGYFYGLKNYFYIFILNFLGTLIIPFWIEEPLSLKVSQDVNPFLDVIVSTFGSYFGACITYYVGLKGQHVFEKYLVTEKGFTKGEKFYKFERLYYKYGTYTLIFAWMPWIGDKIIILAGLMNMPSKIFSIFVFLGCLGNNAISNILLSIYQNI